MRFVLILLILAGIGGAAWWKRDLIAEQLAPAKPPAQVYKWKDADGTLHISSEKPPGNAQIVKVKPLQTMPGMSKEQIDATLHPKKAGDDQMPADCSEDDPVDQAKCIQAATAQRNLAIEKMQKTLSGSK